jgi:hypothetical protein
MKMPLAVAPLVAVTSATSPASDILSIDTRKIHPARWENELVLGPPVKERLCEPLGGGRTRNEPNNEQGRHRTVAKVFAGDIDVGNTLIREGFAHRYEPGGLAKLRRLQTWCGPDARLDQ